MSNEEETKKLLQFRDSMKIRKLELEQELKKLDIAIEEIERTLVNTGFRTFTSKISNGQIKKSTKFNETSQQPQSGETKDQLSITSKDGTKLGNIMFEEYAIIFTPIKSFNFTIDVPPFKSFLIERVLDNMRRTDQERVTNGELDSSEILDYKVQDQDGRIISLTITNYGGDRRLREINSSLRWTLDKMYDKLTKG
jgi:hypothetical protein